MYLAVNPSTDASDPLALIGQLGVAAACVALTLMWQRDTAKQRDRLLAISETQGPILIEIRDALRANSDAHKASAEAQRASADAMAAVSRLRDELQAAEKRAQERGGG